MTFDDIAKLDVTYGSDFYILNTDNFTANLNGFSDAFKKHYRNFRIGYSYKTNYIPAVCQAADKWGAYAEIVSAMELQIARKIGVAPENIIYNGPAKTQDSLEYCLLNGAKVNIDNASEFPVVAAIIKKHPGKNFSIGIRLNVNLGDGSFSRFGFDPDSQEFSRALAWIAGQENLKLAGLHTHATRPNKRPETFIKKLNALTACARAVSHLADLSYIDIGGGFFGKMDDHMKKQFGGAIPDFHDYGRPLGQAMKDFCRKETVELIIEPGVALTANILDYFVKIIDIKTVRDKKIALTTGSFHNVKPSGHTKNLAVEIYSAKGPRRSQEGEYDLAGYTCLENDYLYNGYKGALHVGDYCRFRNVGAYTLVFKPPMIKLAPPIIRVSCDKTEQIRSPEKFEDLFHSFFDSSRNDGHGERDE